MSFQVVPIKEIAHGAFATTYVGLYKHDTAIAIKDFKGNIEAPEAISEIIFYQTHPLSRYRLQYVGNEGSVLYLELGVCNLKQFVHMYAPLSELHVLRVFYQLIRCVKHLHEDLVLAHRDVKPENFILGFDGLFKLADFGCVCSVQNEANDMIGTPLYRPVRCSNPIAMDVFGLACCLYELVAGCQFEGDFAVPGATKRVADCIAALSQQDDTERCTYFNSILAEPLFCGCQAAHAQELNSHCVQLDMAASQRSVEQVFCSSVTMSVQTARYSDLLMKNEQIIFEVKTQGSLFKKQRLLLITDYCRLVGDQIVDLRVARVQRYRKRELLINHINLQFESVTDLNNFLYFYFLAKYELHPLQQCHCGHKFRTFCDACHNAACVQGEVRLLAAISNADLPYQAKLELAARELPHAALNQPLEERFASQRITFNSSPDYVYEVTCSGQLTASEDISEVSSARESVVDGTVLCLHISEASD